MAYLYVRKSGRVEIREAHSTRKGPRSRTLASFQGALGEEHLSPGRATLLGTRHVRHCRRVVDRHLRVIREDGATTTTARDERDGEECDGYDSDDVAHRSIHFCLRTVLLAEGSRPPANPEAGTPSREA